MHAFTRYDRHSAILNLNHLGLHFMEGERNGHMPPMLAYGSAVR